MSKITRASASTASSNIDETTLEMIINKLAPKITAKIEEQLEKLSKQFEKMDTKLNNVAIKLNASDELAHSNQKEVPILRNKLDSFEQTNKMNTLRLVGMKEDVNENLQGSILHLFNGGMKIKCVLGEINNVFRIGKFNENTQKPKTVIVDFVTYLKRNEVYRARATLKGTGIYLNEDLIEKRYQLLMSTKKKQGAQNVWTRYGKIYTKVGNHVKIINGESDLMKADEKL
ncbi:hypothetical protein JTB14_013323 [Gonioctena quinquepunctata]|nr:hypothetical protein JTB14_013323 [Gonioctena quinquepunctata]